VSAPWTLERAEDHLLGLELFGMRFGLDRMRRLMTVLGSPQRAFASIHVVGTNGKSSTVRMIEELLRQHGLRTASYTSPHLASFAERVRIDGREISGATFAAAVQRAAHAAELVNRTLPEDERVTQFEVLTAAAYSELAVGRAEVAVIEAGLGGRFDATSVVPSQVQVLTNVGLEHTRWLGPTVVDIAREKLAVVPESGTLVVGELAPEVEAEAREVTGRQGAELVQAPDDVPGVPLAALGAFQRRNFAVAVEAAKAFLGAVAPGAVAAAAAAVSVPGRCEVVGSDPLTIVEGAHNPAGIRALVDSLPELYPGKTERDLVAVVSILDDKDAAAMLTALLPCCAAVVLTSNANPRALSPATLESLARQVAGEAVPALELVSDPHAAVRRARELAGPQGAVLATGSIYLVADLARAGTARRASTL
jgi:dihydrofolate synthase/folylpolyglutamate synthase